MERYTVAVLIFMYILGVLLISKILGLGEYRQRKKKANAPEDKTMPINVTGKIYRPPIITT